MVQFFCLRKFQAPVDSFFVRACLLAPIIFGLISLYLGADANWDLRNYHLYNAFAFLHQKLTIDLAPAGLQTYFNPLLDLPYYWMSNHLPAPLAGFFMGFLHGFNFIFLALILRIVLFRLNIENPNRLAIYLATFGCLTANFASGLGNTMGDNTTSILNLAALLIIITNIVRSPTPPRQLLCNIFLAGLLAGTAMGLKLTNAPFALALCLSFLLLPMPVSHRLRLALSLGLGATVGLGILHGYWFYNMYQHFGNPLFPQFSHYFHNDLTRDITAADNHWRPTNWWEHLFWPIIISLHPLRVGQLRNHQLFWAALYVLSLLWLARLIITKSLVSTWQQRSTAITFIASFTALGFSFWMLVFSIQRYLVSIDVFTPLLLWLLIRTWTNNDQSRQFSVYIVAGLTVLMFLLGVKTWGHNPWSLKMFKVQSPSLEAPSTATVILTGDAPLAWISTRFPDTTSFVQIGGSFPENFPAYKQRIHHIADSRGGKIYALFQGVEQPVRERPAEYLNDIFDLIDLRSSPKGCSSLASLIQKFKAEKKVKLVPMDKGAHICQLVYLDDDQFNFRDAERKFQQNAGENLHRYGFTLDKVSCITYNAFIGKSAFPYQWCKAH